MSTKKIKTQPIKKIKFVFEKPEEYEPVYVNGIFGGMTPKGELLCHFFMEYVDVPAQEILPIDDKGQLVLDKSQKIPRILDDEDVLVMKRDIKTGIIIPVQQIRGIATWMIDHLEKSGYEIKEATKP